MSISTDDSFINLVHESFLNFRGGDLQGPEKNYQDLKEVIPDVSYYVSDVQRLINYADEHPDFFSSSFGGIAISVLANRVLTSTDTLYCKPNLQHPEIKRYADGFYLGKFLKKGQVIFRGDSCQEIGYAMKGGKIVVEGKHNCLKYPGEGIGSKMKGGEIVIKQGILDIQKSGIQVGENMTDGKITIAGDVDGSAGGSMTGGVIYIKGNLGSLGYDFSGGLITIDGDLLADDIPHYGCNGGEIRIKGAFRGGDVGRSMNGGKVYINKYAGNPMYGIGNEMKRGAIEIGKAEVPCDIGNNMEGGEINFNGDCDTVGTRMYGGKINIAGDVKRSLGHAMRSGKIHVRGNVNSVGCNMEGGTIHISGSITNDIHSFHGGVIYFKGKRLSINNPISRFFTNLKLKK